MNKENKDDIKPQAFHESNNQQKESACANNIHSSDYKQKLTIMEKDLFKAQTENRRLDAQIK